MVLQKTIVSTVVWTKLQEELRQYLDKKLDQEKNEKTEYFLVYTNYFIKSIQYRLDAHPDFESNIRNNPTSFIKEIQNMIHETVRVHYPLVSMTDALN